MIHHHFSFHPKLQFRPPTSYQSLLCSMIQGRLHLLPHCWPCASSTFLTLPVPSGAFPQFFFSIFFGFCSLLSSVRLCLANSAFSSLSACLSASFLAFSAAFSAFSAFFLALIAAFSSSLTTLRFYFGDSSAADASKPSWFWPCWNRCHCVLPVRDC